MEKKPEEIMAIVLDYCHHACPEIGKNVPLYEGAYLKKDIDGYGIYHYWGSDRGNATCICTVPTRSTFIANPNVFTAFYKLLGLDKRDALEAEREKITTLEQQLEEAQNVKFEGMASPAWAMLGELTKFMEEALESDVPRMTNWRIRLEDGEEVTLMNIWAATSHDSPITRATELREMLDAEKEKSKRWESRAWKILQIARRRETEQRPKTAAVLQTLREVSEKNEQLVEAAIPVITTMVAVSQEGMPYEQHVDAVIALNKVLESIHEGKSCEDD